MTTTRPFIGSANNLLPAWGTYVDDSRQQICAFVEWDVSWDTGDNDVFVSTYFQDLFDIGDSSDSTLLLDLEFPTHSAQGEPPTWSFVLSTTDTAFLQLLLENSDYTNIPNYVAAGIWWVDVSGGALEADGPFYVTGGWVEGIELTENPAATSQIKVRVRDGSPALDKASEILYTIEHQKRLYNDDDGFNFVANLESWTEYWGKQQRRGKDRKRRRKKRRR